MRNYLPIFLIVIVILYFWYNKSSFSAEGDNCTFETGVVDINGNYRKNKDDSCGLSWCNEGYVIDEWGSCVEIGSKCPNQLDNGVKVYAEGTYGIGGSAVCKTVCNPG